MHALLCEVRAKKSNVFLLFGVIVRLNKDFNNIMKQRNLSIGQLFNLSFGFFGVQIAYALQSANISRIFATLGADPHQLSFFWILPPLMGMIVQPIIGILSDKTWFGKFFGRRKFYLLIGAVIAVAVMILLSEP